MKKSLKYLFLLFVVVVMFSAISLGYSSSPVSISKAYKDLGGDKGKDCYIIGKFAMVHTKDRSFADEKIASDARDINNESTFSIRIELVNTDNNKVYTFFLKPVTGSDSAYYRNEKVLTENTNDPYWVLKVPEGNYTIRNFICSLTLRMAGYHDFRAPVVEVAVSRVVNENITFSAQAKQIIYIGDYDTTFSTYICLQRSTSLIYSFPRLTIDLIDNFEAVKTSFIDGADDKLKEKLNDYEFVSAL